MTPQSPLAESIVGAAFTKRTPLGSTHRLGVLGLRKFESSQTAFGAPRLEQFDEGDGSPAVAGIASASITGLAFVVVVAGGALLEELLIVLRQIDNGLHPSVFGIGVGLNDRDVVFESVRHDVRKVLALLVDHVWEVDRETRLSVAEDEAVREAAAMHAVQR